MRNEGVRQGKEMPQSVKPSITLGNMLTWLKLKNGSQCKNIQRRSGKQDLETFREDNHWVTPFFYTYRPIQKQTEMF